MITPKERLRKTINKEKTDRPACICPGGMMNMVTAELMDQIKVYLPDAHHDAAKMAKLAAAVYEKGCFENYGVPFCMTVEAEAMGSKIDFGTEICEPHVVSYVIDSVSDYKRLPTIDPKRGRMKIVIDAISILKEKETNVPVIGNLTGPVSVASSLMEPVTFYKELRKKNSVAHEYMDFITSQLITFGREQIRAGADIIAISDPSGTGEILGPRYFKEFAVTYINKLLDALQKEKMGTIVHICGQMSSVYREVNEINSNILSFDSIVQMKEAREHLKGRILMGNISTYALEFGNPDKVKQLTEYCIKNGSDVISPACGLGMKSPLVNVQSILEYLNEVKEDV